VPAREEVALSLGPRSVVGWALLVLPAALLVGWLIGRAPPPDRPAPASTAGSRGDAASRTFAGGNRHAPGPPSPGEPRSLFEDAGARPAVVSSWTSYDAALAESRATGKAILLDFNAEWCPPCRMLKREVFDESAAGRAVCTAVVPVSLVDRRREDGSNPPSLEALQDRFEVDAFPTLVVYSPATGRQQRLEGYAGRERTLLWIQQAAASVR
jgi:protein disulfide-isomerase